MDAFVSAEDAALTKAQNEATRTPVVTAQCKEAFDRVEEKMQDIKKRYFHKPPQTWRAWD
ncbi:MAG: hypothetical protein LBB48_10580 [Treponema sp.]|nr:hypothetical protein [Treponema sp.]